ncbi:pilus assembly protein [Gallaecimonas mangrovi]|uniref:pilus assembly protein n=1 Tax=Gallaecimonas mangrovi TaxID=2291597 RepID=UPI000E1FB8CC|nr:PilC/PilY family type IV pilus protein [Gallaecimonas mangrovi]
MTLRTLVTALLTSLLLASTTLAEDIDLYVVRNGGLDTYKPQLLIIFDNSGSMDTQLDSAYDTYDPATTYAAVDSAHQYQDDIIYYLPNSEVSDNLEAPPLTDFEGKKRRFSEVDNGCAASFTPLAEQGRYSGVVKYVRYQGQSGQWDSLPNNSGLGNKPVVDCLDDFLAEDATNADGYDSGWPKRDPGKNASPYTTNFSITNRRVNEGNSDYQNFSRNRDGFTLFTANYLRYLALIEDGQLSGPKSRLEVAKEAVSDIINSAPGVDFGLVVFNRNTSSSTDGGRVVQALTSRDDMSTFNSIVQDLGADTNTPLCETTAEVMRYLTGSSVVYGNNGGSMTPVKDTSAEDGAGAYVSPFSTCAEKIYVVMITDGEPTSDTDANSTVSSLPGIGSAYSVNGTTTWLPALAGWLHDNDLNSSIAGTQSVDFYTIGFALDEGDNAEPILEETAERGGGEYFSAQEASELSGALQKVVAEVSTKSAAFTSPSIAANNFDRTRSLDSVYYAMFLPSAGPHWLGNIKKLKVTDDDDIVDANGDSAITDSGDISESAKTFWSTSQDGNDTRTGGINEHLRTQAAAGTRTLYTNSSTALVSLTKANLETIAGTEDALATAMDTSSDQIQSTLDWLYGIDVDDDDDDGSNADVRAVIMGDPLHSKPLAINYGTSDGASDVRLLVGTNQGAVHLFKDEGDSAEESWAFFPYQELPKAYLLRENSADISKIYAMDGTPSAWVYDKDDDGVVEPASGDKVWAYIGQRRGGSAYYGLDISNPDSPALLWRIDNQSAGFSELGQSWSTPVVVNIPGHSGPVVIVGAGYDPVSDSDDPSAATTGRGIYIIDAQQGTLVWSATPADTTATNLQVAFPASIPNKIATLDSDGDGLVDRLYASDVAGNIWRVDMPSSAPFDSTNPWTVFKFASLGGSDASNRNFFQAPTIVQTQYTQTVSTQVSSGDDDSTSTVVTTQVLPYDAVVIGSGKRPDPLGTDITDMLFVLRDTNIVTGIQGKTLTTLTLSDLYDMSSQPFAEDLDSEALQTEELALGTAKGWFFDLPNLGEKSLATPLVIDGVAYFTTYTPPASESSDSEDCLAEGVGRLYALDLHRGYNVYDWGVVEIPGKLPDTPVVHAGQDSDGNSVIRIIGVGRVDTGDGSGNTKPTLPVDISMDADRIYYYVEEQ